MEHAEARDLLAEAFATGSGISAIAAIESDGTPRGDALRGHLESCCREEYLAWRETALALAIAAGDDDVRAPAASRERLLAAISVDAPARPVHVLQGAATVKATPLPAGRSSVPRPAFLALAAALAVALFLAGALLGGALGLVPVPDNDDAAANIAAAVDRVLSQPDSVTVPVRDVSGADAGTLFFAPATQELVILSRSLEPPPAGQEYGCYLERDGSRTRIGRMRVEYGTAWWVGAMDEPADAGAPGDLFVVVLGDASGSPLLVGAF